MSKDGIVAVVINGTKYIYSLDAARHESFTRVYERSPGKALAYINKYKNWCEKEK